MSKPTSEIVFAPDPLRQITQWIIAGMSEPDVIDAIEQTWPEKKGKARPLIAEALKKLEDQGEPNLQLLKGFVLEATRDIYRKALEVADFQTALRALKQLNKLARRK